MPKKSLRPPAPPESGPNGPLLGTWQAAGLSMAVIASAAADGLGALLGAVTVIPVIYALTRLRAYAPHARSTAELIGATLGPRAGFAAGAIQLLAYLALAAKFAVALGAVVLVDFSSGDDPAKVVLWLPACALVAALAVGAVVCWVTTRVITTVVFGAAALLLVLLYVFATEANSRIPGDSLVACWVRLIVPALAAVLVVKPVVDAHFARVEVATVIATMLGACAASVAASLSRAPRIPAKSE